MRGLREPVTRHQVDCRADRHFSGRVALPPPHGAPGGTFSARPTRNRVCPGLFWAIPVLMAAESSR